MDLSRKTVVIVGLGRSGVAAARLCIEHGARVIGTDARAAEALSEEARRLAIEIFAGGHASVPFSTADLVVVSPGVPPLSELERAERGGVEVIGELELAARYVSAPILAVGGTNGKSTVTTALAKILEAAGLDAFAGGNLGTPLSEVPLAAEGRTGKGRRPFDVLVVEVSSFQLERAPTFHPRVSVLLNVTEDHLDRYPSFSEYARAKGNAFVNQRPDDVAVVPAGDAVCRAQAERGHAALVTFGSGGDYAVEGNAVVERATGEHFDLGGTQFLGVHNRDNAAAAVAAARRFQAGQSARSAAPAQKPIPAAAVSEGLQRFRPLGHRMAFVADIDGVRYYDDSKATNVGAAVTALLGLAEPRAVLIAGGREKHGSYSPLVAALEQKGRGLVAIGEAAERILEAVEGRLPVARARDMDEAVRRARGMASPGDAVLLSPACSSFDWFTSYAERGDRFVAAVERLRAGRDP